MNHILYYFFILPISYLPYFIIYGVSNFLCFVLKNIIGYRKELIYNNIQKSFPEKTPKEVNEILGKFYSHFTDIIIESFKGFTISKKNIQKRFIPNNQDLINQFKDKNIILIGGHYNNWELCAQAIPIDFDHEIYAIYKPLSNKFFDEKMRKSRGRFGLKLIAMKNAKRQFQEKSTFNKAIIFGSDQSPSNPNKSYWLNFLNQETGFLFGAEKYAREFNWPVIYGTINKNKRGFYSVDYTLISDKPTKTKVGEITSKFAQLLQKDIQNAPEYWLWSHNRWKHKKP